MTNFDLSDNLCFWVWRIVVLGGPFGLWPNISPAFTYAKSLIKLPLDEVEAGSLKLTN